MSDREQASLDGEVLTLTPSQRLVDSPRIVVDGVFFQLHKTGIARVWSALMAQWSASGFARNIVVLDRWETAPRFPGFTYRQMMPLRFHHSLAQSVALEAICKAEQADLFISTNYTIPLKTPSLLYVHDMIPEVLGFNLGQRVWREKRKAIEHASAYVAVSENTARDLRHFYRTIECRPLRIAHNAVDSLFTPSSEPEIEELLHELELPREYCVFVGARDVPYKNASLVFDALPLLCTEQRPAILCVGGLPTLEAEFEARAAAATVRVASLSDAQLRAAYSGALSLLYPSKYEGFGLPILEAMACGCPVITCHNSSIPEAADAAAIYVAEDNPSELAAAMMRLRDPSVRKTFQARGFERVRQFDWKKTADEVERFVRNVAREPAPKA